MLKLRVIDGMVNARLRTGNDLVVSSVTEQMANLIISEGKQSPHGIEGFPLCIDDKWYFEADEMSDENTKNDVEQVEKVNKKRK